MTKSFSARSRGGMITSHTDSKTIARKDFPTNSFPFLIYAAIKIGTFNIKEVTPNGIPPALNQDVNALIMIARPENPPVTISSGS